MNSLENFKPYVSQIGSIIYTTGNNVGNIASSSLKFLGNYIGFGCKTIFSIKKHEFKFQIHSKNSKRLTQPHQMQPFSTHGNRYFLEKKKNL